MNYALTLLLAASAMGQDVPPSLASYTAQSRAVFIEREQALLAVPTRDSLLAYHQMLADEPHIAGTPGDQRTIAEIDAAFRKMGEGIDGWNVNVHEFYPLLSMPISAELSIIAPESVPLEIREKGLGDPAAEIARGQFAYLGYAATGDVTGEVVYANYGTKADFEKLKALGVELKDKIALCRFGGNFRGYKVKFAQEAGAAGVIIFNDPSDVGFTKGAVYPQGPWASDCCIQRGSILVSDFQGDPLTPGFEATKDAKRIDIAKAQLPRIPAQPIGYGAAAEIVKRMTGRELPDDIVKSWTGGLPLAYRIEGGPGLKVRLKVEQRREVLKTANVLATLRGSSNDPADRDRLVIIGAHHDAWNNGAADPTCGTITVLETAKAFAELARKGWRPQRTVIFACWGAEEAGIIGSTEWVEANKAILESRGVAYINLDMASMGPKFGAAASPELKAVISDVAAVVPQAREPSKRVLDAWRSADQVEPPIGDLGGGSDHVGFLMHTGVPSAGFGSGGSEGNSYHSAYDTLRWYWKAVGDDYEPALMVTRMTIATTARLADAPVIPFDPDRALRDFGGYLDSVAKSTDSLDGAAAELARLRDALPAAQKSAIQSDKAAENTRILMLSRRFMRAEGIPGRPWFKNWFVSNDEDSGYATWTLPALRRAVEAKDPRAFHEAVEVYLQILRREPTGG